MSNGFLKPIFSLLVSCFLLASCSTPPRAVVEERRVLTNRQEVEPMGGELVRIVQKGDTLYSIAFSAALDVNQLAAWNKVTDTSRINVGQRIRLTRPLKYVSPRVIKKAARINSSQAKVTQRKSNVRVKRKVFTPNLLNGEIIWNWPATGLVVTKFLPSKGKQGIDILGEKRQKIKASAAGEAVYVGNSLKGYGNLLIIKHNEHFLSAYAHNDEILVSEGQSIARGESVALMGLDKTSRYILHFQIRHNGTPVNPLKFLTKNN